MTDGTARGRGLALPRPAGARTGHGVRAIRPVRVPVASAAVKTIAAAAEAWSKASSPKRPSTKPVCSAQATTVIPAAVPTEVWKAAFSTTAPSVTSAYRG